MGLTLKGRRPSICPDKADGTAVSFDGTTPDYLALRGATPTGVSDGPIYTMSFWMRPDSSCLSTANARLFSFGFDAGFTVPWGGVDWENQSGNLFSVWHQKNDGGAVTTLESFSTDTTAIKLHTWSHVLIAVDTNNDDPVAIWIDGVAQTINVTVDTGEDMALGEQDWAIGAFAFGGGTAFGNAKVSEFWWDTSYVDSPDAFRNSITGRPQDLGSDGSFVTGTAPVLYFKMDATAPEVNAGSGQDWVEFGNLPDYPGPPHGVLQKNTLLLSGNGPVIENTKPITVADTAEMSLVLQDTRIPTITYTIDDATTGKADLLLAGKTPILSWMDVTGKADLILAGNTPTITASQGNHMTAGNADLVLTGASPVITATTNFDQTAGKADLLLTGNSPEVRWMDTVGKADLLLATTPPSVVVTDLHEANTSKASLSMSGATPSLEFGIHGVDTQTAGVRVPRGAALTGVADGKVGTFSVWLNPDDASDESFIVDTSTARFRIKILSDNTIQVIAYDSVPAITMQFVSDAITDINTRGWFHLLISWDLANNAKHLYIDDVDSLSTVTTFTDANIDYTAPTNWTLFNDEATSETAEYHGCISEFYLNTAEYIDFSVEANRRDFIDGLGGFPVNLGPNGSLPTGTAPIIYLRDPFSSFETNYGTGGDFTVSEGAFAACASSPSEKTIPVADKAELTLAGATPDITYTLASFDTGKADLILAGNTPQLDIDVGLSASKADLVLTGKQPISSIHVDVSSADLTLTGKTPFIGEGAVAPPAKADLTLTSSSPAITYSREDIVVGKADLLITGKQAASAIPNITGKADFVLSNGLPVIGQGHCTTKGDLIITGKTPTVTGIDTTISVADNAQFDITGKSPVSSIHVDAGKGDMVLSGNQPIAKYGPVIKTGKNALTWEGKTPDAKPTWYCGDAMSSRSMILEKFTALTGLSDGKVGSVSVWAKHETSTASFFNISDAQGGNYRLRIRFLSSVFNVTAYNSSNTKILDIVSTNQNSLHYDGCWHLWQASWDLAAGTVHIYLDGVDVEDGSYGARTITNDTIEYSQDTLFIYANNSPTAGGIFMESDKYINLEEYIDFSSSTNREKFHRYDAFNPATLRPIDLGSDGSTPTGTAPIVYMTTLNTDAGNNAGTGGDFSVRAGSNPSFAQADNNPCNYTCIGSVNDVAALVLTGNTPNITLHNEITGKATLILTGKTVNLPNQYPGRASLTITGKQAKIRPTAYTQKADLILTSGAPVSSIHLSPSKADLILTGGTPVSSIHVDTCVATLTLNNKLPKTPVDFIQRPGKADLVLTNKLPKVKFYREQAECSDTWTEQGECSQTWTEQSEADNTWNRQTGD